MGVGDTTLICDVSSGHPRPIVPHGWRRRVFDAIHGLSHPSIRRTRKLIADKFVWDGLRREVAVWARTCIPCQSSKVHRHVRAPLHEYEAPERRFSHIHVDLVGPLPVSRGHTYLFTIVDRFTRWPEAIPLTNISTESCARALLSGWVARFGVPIHMTSDRGAQFTSQLWKHFTGLWGTDHSRTTAYHPQANGLVERLHRHLKASLRARLDGPNWMDELPWVLLGIRTAPKEDLGCCSAELVYGSTIMVPGDFVGNPSPGPNPAELLPSLRDKMQGLKPIPASRHGATKESVPLDLAKATHVFIRHDAHRLPLQRPYDGPYRVLTPGDKTFTVQVGTREETISVDRLKPAHVDQDVPVQVAIPPRRGRPPIPRAVPEAETDQAPAVATQGYRQLVLDTPQLDSQQPQQAMQQVDPPTVTRTGRTTRRPARFR